jgi:hypothetical protein
LGATEGIGITNQKDLIKNIIQECDCSFLLKDLILPLFFLDSAAIL